MAAQGFFTGAASVVSPNSVGSVSVNQHTTH